MTTNQPRQLPLVPEPSTPTPKVVYLAVERRKRRPKSLIKRVRDGWRSPQPSHRQGDTAS